MKRSDFIQNKKIKKHKESMGRWVFAIACAGKGQDIVEVDKFKVLFRSGDYMIVEPQTRFGTVNLTRKSVHQAVDRMFDYVEENKL